MKIFQSINLVTLLLVGSIFIGCSKSSSNKSTVFDESQKSFLYSLFTTEYLWADEVNKDINYTKFTTPQEMIDEVRYSTDIWSFSQTEAEYHNRANQVTSGFGCFFSGIEIFFIQIDSPCDRAGIKRGDNLFLVNFLSITPEIYLDAMANLGEEVIFSVERNGTYLDIPITPTNYEYKSTKYQILNAENNVKVGHMIFDGFTSQSVEEIDEAFTYFSKNNVKELVVDLRYNGGGSLATMSILMDKIAGYNNQDKVQAHLQWNANYIENDSYYYFEKDDNSLNLSRVFFLTTQRSASASEVTINGLKPYIDVVLIGKKTHGKPVGMRGKIYNGLIYWLINFSSYNANGEGDFYNGIDVDCSIEDVYSYERTDTNEPMLNQAVYYINNNSCK